MIDQTVQTGMSIDEMVMHELKRRVDFTHDLNSSSRLRLFFHQANRIYEAVENGNKRILCADATGAGKTLVALATKFLRDVKQDRRSTALVFAPGQTMDSVWSQ